MAIKRVWQAWTTPDNADVYEALLAEDIFPGIIAKGIDGLTKIELLRRSVGNEVEFMVTMYVDSEESLKKMAGEDAERAYVPDVARKVLKRFEDRARHFEIRRQHLLADPG